MDVRCDWCTKTAVTSWREGSGTGHSEGVYACEDHEFYYDAEAVLNQRIRDAHRA